MLDALYQSLAVFFIALGEMQASSQDTLSLFIVGSPSLFGSLISILNRQKSASQCSSLSPTLIMIIDLMVMIIAMNHDRNHGDDKLINVVLPWN